MGGGGRGVGLCGPNNDNNNNDNNNISPHQTGRVRGQTTQSLWRITCPPPEQTPRTCREDPLGQQKKKNK